MSKKRTRGSADLGFGMTREGPGPGMSRGGPGPGPGRAGGIVTPGEHRSDAEAAQFFEMLKRNPLFPTVSKLAVDVADLQEALKTLQTKHTMLAIQHNAMLVYADQEGFFDEPSGAHTFDQWVEEHHTIARFLPVLMRQVTGPEQLPMRKAMEEVREFNRQEGRLQEIRGHQFGLIQWLNENPEELSVEELKAVGKEFGLEYEEDPEDGGPAAAEKEEKGDETGQG